MASVLDRVPVDDITAEARSVRFGATLLTLLGFLLFALGWIVSSAWLAVCWCAVAVRAGWRQAQRRDGG